MWVKVSPRVQHELVSLYKSKSDDPEQKSERSVGEGPATGEKLVAQGWAHAGHGVTP